MSPKFTKKDIEDLNNLETIFFVMDENQYRILKKHYQYKYVYMLGIFQHTNNLIIKDPYHDKYNNNAYYKSFEKIIESINTMKVALKWNNYI